MTTSPAQKRARETGMVTKCVGICVEGKETLEQIRKVRSTRKVGAALSVILVPFSRWHCGIPMGHYGL